MVRRKQNRKSGRVADKHSNQGTDSAVMANENKYEKFVPFVMFGLLLLGLLLILGSYLVDALSTSPWYLIAGLVCILGGIVAATFYR